MKKLSYIVFGLLCGLASAEQLTVQFVCSYYPVGGAEELSRTCSPSPGGRSRLITTCSLPELGESTRLNRTCPFDMVPNDVALANAKKACDANLPPPGTQTAIYTNFSDANCSVISDPGDLVDGTAPNCSNLGTPPNTFPVSSTYTDIPCVPLKLANLADTTDSASGD